MTRQITLPLSQETASSLHAGDQVELSGSVITGRDQACGRLFSLLSEGSSLPVDLKNQIMYFVGPTPAQPGAVIGSAGPTTSGRMNPYLPSLLAQGLRGFIGKGHIADQVKQSLVKHKAVYFGAIGGTGALLSSTIDQVEIIAFEDLLTEAMRRMYLNRFPVVVLCDTHGQDLYAQAMGES